MNFQAALKNIRKKRVLLPLLVLILELAAYSQKKGDDKNRITGRLQSDQMTEISGIAASAKHPDIFYMHNDSGDSSRFFSVNAKGQLQASYHFKASRNGPGVIDCEDIAVGPVSEDGKSYIYLGDIGDNGAFRRGITVYRFPEPQLSEMPGDREQVVATSLNFVYPDGPRDAETLMIDPIDKMLYIVSKREKNVGIYTAPLNLKSDKDTLTLTKRGELHFSGIRPFSWVVGGSISQDGQHILLKTYTKVYYWKRNTDEAIWQTLQRKPVQLAYEQERQGEAITFAPDAKSYYTVSEGKKAPIYRYFIPKN